jgi:hypothetical protein
MEEAIAVWHLIICHILFILRELHFKNHLQFPISDTIFAPEDNKRVDICSSSNIYMHAWSTSNWSSSS